MVHVEESEERADDLQDARRRATDWKQTHQNKQVQIDSKLLFLYE